MSAACSVLSADRSFSIFYVAAFAAAMAMLYVEGRRRAWPTSSWLVLVAAGRSAARLIHNELREESGTATIP